jgi:peptide/nickel transport system permease protein
LVPCFRSTPNKIAIKDRFQAPSIEHLLGTDNLGRDLFSRTAQGTRSALVISLLVVALSLLAGAIIGIAAGMAGGWVDRAIIVFFDIVNSYPAVILAMGLVALYGTGFGNRPFPIHAQSACSARDVAQSRPNCRAWPSLGHIRHRAPTG